MAPVKSEVSGDRVKVGKHCQGDNTSLKPDHGVFLYEVNLGSAVY